MIGPAATEKSFSLLRCLPFIVKFYGAARNIKCFMEVTYYEKV